MKILKYLLIILIVLLIGSWGYVSTQANNYDVQRSKIIKAPKSVVFEQINEFKNWKKWGPWMEEDPTIVATYPELTKGVGGSYSWTSKDGPGNLKTVQLVENKSIEQKIQFNDYEPSDVYWQLEEVEEGTEVIWGMKAEKTPFMFKLAAVFSGGMDAMLGPMLEKGLENLDTIIMEELPNLPPSNSNFRIGVISQKELPNQVFIGYFVKDKIENLPALFAEYMPKAGMYAAAQKLEYSDYTPGALYIKYDEEKGETELYIGLLVKNDIKAGEGMELIDIKKGGVVTLSKFGNYGEGDMEAHTNIANYLTNNNLEMGDFVWELYMNDPTTVQPKDIQTDIFYQIK